MPTDFKIGLGLGLVIVAGATVWIAVRSDDTIGSPSSHVLEKVQPPHHVCTATRASVEDGLGNADQSLLENLESDTVEKGRSGPEMMEWPKIHVVEQGQTLSQISMHYYGTSAKWNKILEANRLRLKNKDRIRPGMRLIIPR